MMYTSHAILFAVVFLGQIYFMSWYFPRRIHRRMTYVIAHYPPEQYPRLYPKPREHYVVGHWLFKTAYQVLLVLGFVALAGALLVDGGTFADDGYISEIWPAIYAIAQMVPLMALEFSGYSQLRQMRKATDPSLRKAELKPRRLFNHVSPGLVICATVLFAAAAVLALYSNGMRFEPGHDSAQLLLVMLVTNIFMASVGAWSLYGRKLNPHQSNEQRRRQVSASLRSILYASMLLSVFCMSKSADDMFDLDFLDATLLSVYMQAIVWVSVGTMMGNCRIEDADFEAYRADEDGSLTAASS